jgi:hypothetical protein
MSVMWYNYHHYSNALFRRDNKRPQYTTEHGAHYAKSNG